MNSIGTISNLTAKGEINISQCTTPQELAEIIAKIPLEEIEEGEDYRCTRLRKMSYSNVSDDKLEFGIEFETQGPEYCLLSADSWAKLHWHELNAIPNVKMDELSEK